MAKLKYQIDAAAHTALDETVQGLYRKDGDNFILDLDGDPVDEFRGNNRKLFGENEDLKKKLDAATEENAGLKKQVEEKGQENEQEKTDLAARLDALEKSNKEKDEAIAQANAQASRDAAGSAFADLALSSHGGRKDARGDLAREAISAGFTKVGDGSFERRDSDGNLVQSEAKPGQAQTLDEFAVSLAEQKPYLFGESGGDGAEGSGERPGVRYVDRGDMATLKDAEVQKGIAEGKILVR